MGNNNDELSLDELGNVLGGYSSKYQEEYLRISNNSNMTTIEKKEALEKLSHEILTNKNEYLDNNVRGRK